jgi:hypothetical protein
MIDINKRKYYLRLYLFALIFSCITSFIFAPTSYPILGYLVGAGRFDDWWNTLSFLQKYPINSEYICTIPWVFTFFLKGGGEIFGPFLFYIIFVCTAIALLIPAFIILSNLYGWIYSSIIIFSYPILFSFWRGNSDLFIYGLILSCYFCSIHKEIGKSLVYCGIAIMFKPYQIFYLLAYNLHQLFRYKLLIMSGFIVGLVLIYLGDHNFFVSSWRNLESCGSWYNKVYVIGDGGTLHNNSLWGFSKFILFFLVDNNIDRNRIINELSIYLKLWPFILIGLYFSIRGNFKIFINDKNLFSSNIFLISLLVAIFSPITPDYRLFFISICTIIFLTKEIHDFFSYKLIIFLLLTILIPKEFLWIKFGDVSFTLNGPINFVLMFILLFYIFFKSILNKEYLIEIH